MPRPEPATKNILIVGGLLVDDIAISTENLRPGCSNPVRWHHCLGGVATNVARVAAQQVGVLLIACTGDELFVGLANSSLVEQMRWSDIEKRLPEWRPEAIVLDANLSQSCLNESITALASHYETRVPFFALSVSPAKSVRWLNVADKVDVLLCNRREAAALTKLDWQCNINTLADGLSTRQFSSFVITDGGEPILVQERQTRTFVPVPDIDINTNVNGAGDAMAGAAIVEMVKGQGLAQAISVAGLSAARAVLIGESVSPSI